MAILYLKHLLNLFYGVVKLKVVDQADGPFSPFTLTRQ